MVILRQLMVGRRKADFTERLPYLEQPLESKRLNYITQKQRRQQQERKSLTY